MMNGAHPQRREQESTLLAASPSPPWQLVVWDDPVNLMSYVTYVLTEHFGFTVQHAESLMLRIHNDGSAVIVEGSREAMELHVEAMHSFGLWATVRQGGNE